MEMLSRGPALGSPLEEELDSIPLPALTSQPGALPWLTLVCFPFGTTVSALCLPLKFIL